MSSGFFVFLGLAIGALMLRHHIYRKHMDLVERYEQNIKPKLTRVVQVLSLITLAIWAVVYLLAEDEQRNNLIPALKATFYGDDVKK
ncbi:MAG: hypothetical protein HOB79_05105 [Rhodospirillaceae bacterium]|jgi:hypothetical protein|nr:hypothetical protein [Rhodospirillales bacterium]MBT3906892.1 hypothetical protein [Rhodospirillaceae bacterium]MBT4700432.1 hypothetical protein [Rhodospirillaceae bacterium]MBT5033281.1 hypothetical protein [Rhodospirillaceae bacterium]MBT6220959.1 hypothetical protein [Rhodospirillaceae bacterium]